MKRKALHSGVVVRDISLNTAPLDVSSSLVLSLAEHPSTVNTVIFPMVNLESHTVSQLWIKETSSETKVGEFSY